MQIPKIIHQTWKDSQAPASLEGLMKSWQKHHPGWTYKLWTDDQNQEFIKSNYPWFLEIYDHYPYKIQQVDAVRYFILHAQGGIFVDLDFECLKSIEPLLAGKECVFGLEPALHCQLHNVDKIIPNAFMACVAGHPFLARIIDELASYNDVIHLDTDRNRHILETTGPFMVSRVYNEVADYKNITLVPSELLYPFTIYELAEMVDYRVPPSASGKITDAYAIHFHMGTWWRPEETNKPISNSLLTGSCP